MTNFLVKRCLNEEITKISNLIDVKIKNNACPRPKFNRRPNLFESRICPNTECTEFRMFRSNRNLKLSDDLGSA